MQTEISSPLVQGKAFCMLYVITPAKWSELVAVLVTGFVSGEQSAHINTFNEVSFWSAGNHGNCVICQ